MAMAAREENVFKAKLAEEAERFDEMVEFMNKVVSGVNGAYELTSEERNLLSVAYKNVIGPRRNALRILSSFEQKEHSRGNESRAAAVGDYRLKVEDELSNICHGLLELIDSKLLIASTPAPDPAPAPDTDSKVFFLKMKGDYNRYLAEFKIGSEKKIAADNTLSAYKAAQEIAKAELAPTHPIRLGLALNFAVFYYEILSSPERACTLAKEAFDEAIPELDSVGEESYKASTMIMQLLRDNLTLWTSDLKDDGTDDIGEAPKPKNEQ